MATFHPYGKGKGVTLIQRH